MANLNNVDMEIERVNLKSYNDFLEQQEALKYVRKELEGEEEKVKELREQLDKLQRKERYKYSDIVVKEHKFWITEDMQTIMRIDENEKGTYYVSTKGKEIEHKYYTSSLGMLWDCPIPITEKCYREILNEWYKEYLDWRYGQEE